MRTGNNALRALRRLRAHSLCFVLIAIATFLLAAKPAYAQLPVLQALPAFPNADLKEEPSPTVPNWGRIGFQTTLAASYRRCGYEMLEVEATTLGYKGGLGGDYWKVPMPVHLTGMGSDCALVIDYNTQPAIVKTPTFTPTRGARWVTFYTYVPDGEVKYELRSGSDSLRTSTLKTGASINSIDLLGAAYGKGDLYLVFSNASLGSSALVLTNFRLWKSPPATGGELKVVNLGGFADTHTHPFANLGFGGSLIFGDPGAPWTKGGGFENCRHDWPGGGGDVNKSLVTSALEPAGHAGEGGYPDFKYWPRFNSIIHQQLHVNWLKRAWRGGQRLIVFHAVNNALFARYFRKDSDPTAANDMVATYRQLAAMKTLVAKHSDFMQIAYTPAEARKIIEDGKLVVILGVEVDALFACHEKPGLISEQGVALHTPCTDGWVDQELDKLYKAGVRHVFPIHLIDNEFGGTALYRSSFARYENWFRGENIVPDTADAKQQVYLSLDQGWDLMDDTLGPALANIGSGVGNFSFGKGPHVNSKGLRPIGERTIQKMWDKGMMVDIDHMSELAMNRTIVMAKERGVAIISGHTGFRELQFNNNQTEIAAKIGSENNKSTSGVRSIHSVGGVIGIGTAPSDVQTSKFGSVPNNCAGSSSSWAQLYTYAVGMKSTPPPGMPGFIGITLGSDMHLQEQLFPRFGVWACMGKHEGILATGRDSKRPLSNYNVHDDAGNQTGGVTYRADQPVFTFYNTRFKHPNTEGHFATDTFMGMGGWGDSKVQIAAATKVERAAMQALVVWKSGKDPMNPAVSNANELTFDKWGVWQHHWVEGVQQLALGFAQTKEQQSFSGLPEGGCHDINPHTYHKYQCDYTFGTDCFGCGERRTAYLVKTGWTTPNPKDIPSVQARVKELMPEVLWAWRRFQEMSRGGNPNAPLERCQGPECGGNREFDFNLDGLAHYGLIPDMLQDVSNQLRAQKTGEVHDLRALFRGADDYITMWEKTWGKRAS